jgi:hypothetical protein
MQTTTEYHTFILYSFAPICVFYYINLHIGDNYYQTIAINIAAAKLFRTKYNLLFLSPILLECKLS